MNTKLAISLCLIIGFSCKTGQENEVALKSPDGRIEFLFTLKNNSPLYNVSFNNKPIIEASPLSLSFLENGEFKNNIRIGDPIFEETFETYQLVIGKSSEVKDRFKSVLIPMEEVVAPFRKINLLVRAFNDGLAFRYEVPQQANWLSISLAEENTSFKFVDNPKLLTLFLPNFITSHEGEYSSLLLSEVKEDTLMDMPALFEFPGKAFVAVTEAALLDYAGMYLVKKDSVLVSKLSPLPEKPSIKVQSKLPHHSPWRVLMISDRIGGLIESNILTTLSDPSKITDLSWIKPGKTTFPWWNGSIIPDTTFKPANDFENNKYYIDFCARNGIEYHSVVEAAGHEWYTNDGENYQPGPNVDVTKPVPGLDMKRICDYAKSKSVDIRVWVHWKALYPKLDTAFALFEKWGIKGMMVDFMDRDDQEMVRIQEEILQKAAKHKLHIQWHGAYKPTGLSRTYPNEFTREGTLNYEVNKWDKRVTPDHDLNIVFTRSLAGSTDYHLGGFRAVPDSNFKIQFIKPLMLGTRCHMLAMYVVLESSLGMVCDYPAAYEGQPGFEFIKAVPTTWDETKVPDAKLNEYVSIARRKGNEWYVGSITNSKARTISIPLSFLSEGDWEATIYSDATNADQNPNQLSKEIRLIKKTDSLTLKLAGGGGAAIQLKKKN